jgi:hypothetical protein
MQIEKSDEQSSNDPPSIEERAEAGPNTTLTREEQALKQHRSIFSREEGR